MRHMRHGVVGLAVAALVGGATFLWTSDNPERARVAYASDPGTAVMGAASLTAALTEGPMWERFEREKKAAGDSELAPQF